MSVHRASLDAPSAPKTASDIGDTRLQKVWSHEFLHVAMMTAFATMGCNRLAAKGSPAGMAAVEGNIPDEPAVHRAIRQRACWSCRSTFALCTG
jgi:hypothetical protein